MNERLKNVAAMLLVGDGLLTALGPRKETLMWDTGPKPYRAVMEMAANRPYLARLFGLAELGVGLWIATQQWDKEKAA